MKCPGFPCTTGSGIQSVRSAELGLGVDSWDASPAPVTCVVGLAWNILALSGSAQLALG